MSTSYTEKTHSAFHGAPIDTSDPKTLAWLIRRHGLEMTHISRGSHIGAIFSVAEIMAVLYTRILRVDPKNPQWENRDRLILSKGHAGASVYAALAERGFFPVEELSTHYANGSRLSGHVSHKGVPGVEFSTGSLGHGLSVAAGMALGGKKDNADWRVYCVLGDGECDEGSVWEAALQAHQFKLDNLVAIIGAVGFRERINCGLDSTVNDFLHVLGHIYASGLQTNIDKLGGFRFPLFLRDLAGLVQLFGRIHGFLGIYQDLVYHIKAGGIREQCFDCISEAVQGGDSQVGLFDGAGHIHAALNHRRQQPEDAKGNQDGKKHDYPKQQCGVLQNEFHNVFLLNHRHVGHGFPAPSKVLFVRVLLVRHIPKPCAYHHCNGHPGCAGLHGRWLPTKQLRR